MTDDDIVQLVSGMLTGQPCRAEGVGERWGWVGRQGVSGGVGGQRSHAAAADRHISGVCLSDTLAVELSDEEWGRAVGGGGMATPDA